MHVQLFRVLVGSLKFSPLLKKCTTTATHHWSANMRAVFFSEGALREGRLLTEGGMNRVLYFTWVVLEERAI